MKCGKVTKMAALLNEMPSATLARVLIFTFKFLLFYVAAQYWFVRYAFIGEHGAA